MPKVFKCEVCNKPFPVQSELNRHMQTHIKSGKKPHHCDSCGLDFQRKSHLIEHQRGVHTEERPYSCPECGGTFAQSGTLRNHMQLHNRSHVCSICNKTFTRNSSLKYHMRRKHPKPTTVVTTESHEEPAGTVTTTTHSFSTDSSAISVSYIQPPNTETKVPIQVVTQLTGPIETTTVMQSSETSSDSQSVDDFDAFQEKLVRELPDLE